MLFVLVLRTGFWRPFVQGFREGVRGGPPSRQQTPPGSSGGPAATWQDARGSGSAGGAAAWASSSDGWTSSIEISGNGRGGSTKSSRATWIDMSSGSRG